jgi:hypothetical protein
MAFSEGSIVFLTKLRRALVRVRAAGATAVALGALLVVPMPALAIFFLTPWNIVQNVQTGGAPRAQIARAWDAHGRHGIVTALQVNMGAFQAKTSAVSSVLIQREFRVDSPAGEKLTFKGLLGGAFKNSSATATALIGHYDGSQVVVDQRIPLFRGHAGKGTLRFGLNRSFLSRRLAEDGGQPYFLMVSIRYAKNRGGFWHDRGSSASFHRFEVVRG